MNNSLKNPPVISRPSPLQAETQSMPVTNSTVLTIVWSSEQNTEKSCMDNFISLKQNNILNNIPLFYILVCISNNILNNIPLFYILVCTSNNILNNIPLFYILVYTSNNILNNIPLFYILVCTSNNILNNIPLFYILVYTSNNILNSVVSLLC